MATPDPKPKPEEVSGRRTPRLASLLLALALGLSPVGLYAQTAERISFYYTVSQTEPSDEDGKKLRAFLKQNYAPGKAVFVQGYGCDLGGFERSLVIARRRGRRARALVTEALIPPGAIFSAGPIVHYGRPRKPHRRVVFAVYETQAQGRAALAQANARAGRINEETRKKLQADEETAREAEAAAEAEARAAREAEAAAATPADHTSATDANSGKEHSGWPAWLCWLLWILLILLLLLLLYYLWKRYQSRRERESHQLSQEEAEALDLLTGGDVQPVATLAPAGKARSVAKKLSRRLPMAKKKAKKEINSMNIRGAVDKEFEGKTLNQIRRAPIHALEGLTPRHAMLLKEGFGIDTIEDLAKLKYFEIAKAITVLAKYEK